jgi:metal-responsive CopG/Arc/MetJ family transcriptional regulator
MGNSKDGDRKTHIMQIRIHETLWKKFQTLCDHSDTTPSETIREMIRNIVRESRDLDALLLEHEGIIRAEMEPLSLECVDP